MENESRRRNGEPAKARGAPPLGVATEQNGNRGWWGEIEMKGEARTRRSATKQEDQSSTWGGEANGYRPGCTRRFTQLEIDPQGREKLAFQTQRGRCNRPMPGGYKNGPARFHQRQQTVLGWKPEHSPTRKATSPSRHY